MYLRPIFKVLIFLKKLITNSFDSLPSIRKLLKLVQSIECKGRRPDIVTGNVRPKGYTHTFKSSRGSKTSVSYLLNGQELKHEVANGTCAYIHQPMIGGGILAFHVSRFELPISPVSLVPAEPHVHVARNSMVKSKCVTDALGEKGAGVAPLLVVHDNGGLKRKKRN